MTEDEEGDYVTACSNM